MTEIEKKALALVNEVQKVRGHTGSPWNSPAILNEALYRAIEQHEALEAEVERWKELLHRSADQIYSLTGDFGSEDNDLADEIRAALEKKQ